MESPIAKQRDTRKKLRLGYPDAGSRRGELLLSCGDVRAPLEKITRETRGDLRRARYSARVRSKGEGGGILPDEKGKGVFEAVALGLTRLPK